MRSVIPLDERQSHIKSQSRFTKHYIEDAIKFADQLVNDPAKNERLEKLLCRFCFHRSRIAGQAFTDYNCEHCGNIESWHNTATPRVCKLCATELSLCRMCGGEINL